MVPCYYGMSFHNLASNARLRSTSRKNETAPLDAAGAELGSQREWEWLRHYHAMLVWQWVPKLLWHNMLLPVPSLDSLLECATALALAAAAAALALAAAAALALAAAAAAAADQPPQKRLDHSPLLRRETRLTRGTVTEVG